MALEMLRHNSVNFSKMDFIIENLEKIISFYNDFSRSPHRFDVLGTINNALYIDDSKSTNVSSMINALESSRQIKNGKEVILILGGDAKGQDFGDAMTTYTGKGCCGASPTRYLFGGGAGSPWASAQYNTIEYDII